MRTVAAAAGLLLLLTGCGGSVVDTQKAERFLDDEISTQLGADVRSVRCPADIAIEKGATFTCTVTGTDGSQGEAEMVQRDDRGRVDARVPFVPTRQIEGLIAKQLGAGGRRSVQCPEIIVTKKGDRFTCRTKSGRQVKLLQKDDRNHVEIVL